MQSIYSIWKIVSSVHISYGNEDDDNYNNSDSDD